MLLHHFRLRCTAIIPALRFSRQQPIVGPLLSWSILWRRKLRGKFAAFATLIAQRASAFLAVIGDGVQRLGIGTTVNRRHGEHRLRATIANRRRKRERHVADRIRHHARGWLAFTHVTGNSTFTRLVQKRPSARSTFVNPNVGVARFRNWVVRGRLVTFNFTSMTVGILKGWTAGRPLLPCFTFHHSQK
jgi:hypothetical protein